jgi:uncharacterized membrane protein YfcA
MTVTLLITLGVLGMGGALVSGLLGVGGAIVMIPLLLYVPPLIGAGVLDMREVAGITMVQVFAAAVSGVVAHRRHRAVNERLAWIGGISMGAGTLAGALASSIVPSSGLLVVFALMATAAAGMLFLPLETVGQPIFGEKVEFSTSRAIAVAAGVGLGAGLVGAGGAFLLVPMLLYVVGIPIRVTIGSSLAITALAAISGVAGKLATGQVPLAPALAVIVGALPGAQIGSYLSARVSGRVLRAALAVVVIVSALRVWWDVLTRVIRGAM